MPGIPRRDNPQAVRDGQGIDGSNQGCLVVRRIGSRRARAGVPEQGLHGAKILAGPI